MQSHSGWAAVHGFERLLFRIVRARPDLEADVPSDERLPRERGYVRIRGRVLLARVRIGRDRPRVRGVPSLRLRGGRVLELCGLLRESVHWRKVRRLERVVQARGRIVRRKRRLL